MAPKERKERLRDKRRRARVWIAAGIVVLFSVLSAGVIWCLWQPWARVERVTVAGATAIPVQSVEAYIYEKLTGGVVVPNNSVVLFREKTLARLLKDEFPRIETVSYEWRGIYDVSLHIEERVPYALWCGASRDLPTECYLFDDDGFLFAPTPPLEGYRTWYSPLAIEGETLRNHVFKEGVVREIDALLLSLGHEGLTIRSVGLRAPDEVDLILDDGARVTYVLGEENYVRQVLPALLREKLQGEAFEYVDLRFGRKAYIKR